MCVEEAPELRGGLETRRVVASSWVAVFEALEHGEVELRTVRAGTIRWPAQHGGMRRRMRGVVARVEAERREMRAERAGKDRLGEDGRRIERQFVETAVCARSRSSRVPSVISIGIGRSGVRSSGSSPAENAVAANTVERSTPGGR